MAQKPIEIVLDDVPGKFILSGYVDKLLLSPRIKFQLKNGMSAINLDDKLGISYTKQSKEKVLKNLRDILRISGSEVKYTKEMREVETGFIRAQETFDLFASRAREIRNDNFKTDEKLMEEFKDFIVQTKKNLSGRTLYPLQLLSAYHMAFSQNVCNFSVPGAGKTTIVYAAYSYLKNIDDESKKVDKILIIGPTSAFGPWEDEYEGCFGEKPSIVRVSDCTHIGRQNHLYAKNPAEVTIIGYQLLDRYQEDIEYFLRKHRVMLVVDEAHYIKSVRGVWSSALLKFSSQAISRIALTGTPAPNGYEDIFNIYRFILPYNFERVIGMNYASLKDLVKDQLHPERATEFAERIAPFFMRIKKSDLKSQLPKIVDHHPIKISMSETQKSIYDYIDSKYTKSFINSNSDSFKHKLAKAKIIRLRQAASNPGLLAKPLEEYYQELGYTDSLGINDSDILAKIVNYHKDEVLPPKFVALRDLVNGILKQSANQKVLIWSQFILNSKLIKNMFKNDNTPSELLIGEVDKSDRRMIIKRFNNPEDTSFRVVIANPKAVGESISLHKGCNTAVYFDMDYNAASFVQSKDRIHRVMRPLPEGAETHYYSIISNETIDKVILDKIDEKVKLMENLTNRDIPLFISNGSDDNCDDSTNLVKALINDYIRRHNS
jgi:SNF2 family DNA or RNA helicase